MDASSFPWFTMIWQTLLVSAVSFVLIVLITSFVRYRLLTDTELAKSDPNATWADRFRIRLLAWIGLHKKGSFLASILRPSRPLTREEADRVESVLLGELRPEDEQLADGTERWGLLWKIDYAETRRVGERILRDLGEALPGVPVSLAFARYPQESTTPEELFRVLEQATAATADHSILTYVGEPPPPATAHPPESQGDLDPVTGLLPYDRAERFLQKFLATQRRKDFPVSFILLSIDRMADLQQRHGEEALLQVLKELSRLMLAEIRESDPITRWGTDGFMIAASTQPTGAMTLARRIVELAEHHQFLPDSRRLRLHLSAGVTGYPEVSGAAAVYLNAVEDALYTARDRGGRQVVRYEPSMLRQETQDKPTDVF